jgi:hypothetical protein
MKPAPSVVARFVADDYFAAHDPSASADARMALATRVETALRAAIAEEREACAALCDKRAELWQRTEATATTPLRADARSRSVEAAFIGDAIRAREELR